MSQEEIDTLENAARDLGKVLAGDSIVEVKSDTAWGYQKVTLVMKSGKRVVIDGYGDCCAGAGITDVTKLGKSENVITRVETTEDGEKWHIYANLDQVLGIEAYAGEGSGYYGYGFTIQVKGAGE